MTATPYFDDGTAGDTGTFEQDVESNSFNTRPTRGIQSAEASLWAQGYLETSHTLTGASIQCAIARTWTAVNPECVASEEEPTAPSDAAQWTLDAWDGIAWMQVDSGALTITTSPQQFAVTASFSPITTCWLRLRLVHTVYIVSCEGLLIAECLISDIRPTGTDTGIACAEGVDGGGGPGDTGGGGEGGGGGDDCGCADWELTSQSCQSWTKTNRSYQTWTYNSPCTPAG